MVQVDQPLGDRKLIPVLPPERLPGDWYIDAILLFETHYNHYTFNRWSSILVPRSVLDETPAVR